MCEYVSIYVMCVYAYVCLYNNTPCVQAMHLMSICKGGGTLPAALPSNLIPPLAPDALAIAPAGSTWIVTNELKGKYYRFFASIDRDNDGFLYRDEVMPIFIASKVPQPTLSHIW